VPVSPLNRVSLAGFNEMWFRRAPRSRDDEIVGVAPYFYPLDAVGGWNRLYGRRGFLQYQFAIPDSGSDVVRRTLERLGALRTRAIDLPARTPGLGVALDLLDEEVLAVGGRHYLAKDSRAVPATIAAGYPRLGDFRTVKNGVDPHGVFVSDLSRRLHL
jgi:decaprenylphospho-beta-D-ribofuranose 2-oxidase